MDADQDVEQEGDNLDDAIDVIESGLQDQKKPWVNLTLDPLTGAIGFESNIKENLVRKFNEAKEALSDNSSRRKRDSFINLAARACCDKQVFVPYGDLLPAFDPIRDVCMLYGIVAEIEDGEELFDPYKAVWLMFDTAYSWATKPTKYGRTSLEQEVFNIGVEHGLADYTGFYHLVFNLVAVTQSLIPSKEM